MKKNTTLVLIVGSVILLIYLAINSGIFSSGPVIFTNVASASEHKKGDKMSDKVEKTDEEWRQELTPEQYRVLREKGTERPFTGEYNEFNEKGVYLCAACGAELFGSDTKFESGCGWPSYYAPMNNKNITESADTSLGMVRTEITCTRCGSHLGHVFEDGPKPTGLRYCVNSVSLEFKKADTSTD